NAGLSLFRRDGDGLHLVALNDDSGNDTPASPGSPDPTPLLHDPVVFAGLTSGDYYLVVSSSGNLPDPVGPDLPFPADSPLGKSFEGGGIATGAFVLNAFLQPDNQRPRVVEVTPHAGDVLDGPLLDVVVRFSEAVNVPQLAGPGGVMPPTALAIEDVQSGRQFPLSLEAYNQATNQAVFFLNERLPPGTYQLHLEG